jgi:hypothetical protein
MVPPKGPKRGPEDDSDCNISLQSLAKSASARSALAKHFLRPAKAFQCGAKPNASLPWSPGNYSREGSLCLTVHYRSCATCSKPDVGSLLTQVIL